jgi:hypothetical protein
MVDGRWTSIEDPHLKSINHPPYTINVNFRLPKIFPTALP